MSVVVEVVEERDLDDLLPLFRGYLDFYGTAPGDEDVLALCRALITDPEREGLQLLARDADGRALGFATLYWGWSSTQARRSATMNDLFVAEHARGSGAADALIAACAAQARARGIVQLDWVTAPDNHRAQAVYDRTGAARSEWVEYTLPTE
jgi:ribosomal protein S18 acetylase RimI-like enzyme